MASIKFVGHSEPYYHLHLPPNIGPVYILNGKVSTSPQRSGMACYALTYGWQHIDVFNS